MLCYSTILEYIMSTIKTLTITDSLIIIRTMLKHSLQDKGVVVPTGESGLVVSRDRRDN